MCNCKGKCGCNISTITKGEKGDAGQSGTTGVSFYAFKAQTVDAITTIDVQTTVAADGDYVVQLQANVGNNDAAAVNVTTRAYKNGAPDTLNDNYTQTFSDILVSQAVTYTHTAKLTGLSAGQTVGCRFLATGDVLISNGSLTIFKA
jgi:hypothetical protein